MMLWKNRNKKVGLCVMVVTSCLVLAVLWAVLATPETALADKPDKPPGQDKPDKPGKGGNKTAYSVDAVSDVSDHDTDFNPLDPTLHSTCSGLTGENSLYVKWPRFERCIVITPLPPEGKPSYELSDDPQLNVMTKRGEVIAVQLYIQDEPGPDGIMHSSDHIPVDSVEPLSAGFILHIHADNVQVWRHKGHTGGPRVEMIGTISVGDIVFTPAGQ